MRKFALPLILVASLGVSSVAMAASSTAQGVVKSIDQKTMNLTLDNGTVYHLDKSIKLASFKPGTKVKITYEKKGNTNEVTAVSLR